MLGTVKRTGEALDLFTFEQPEWGVTAVARRLGLAKSSAHALLSTLTEIGLLERTSMGRYRLGWRALTMGRVVLGTTTYRTAAVAMMRRLVARYGETAYFAVWERNQVVYLDTVQSGDTRVHTPARAFGVRLPAHISAVGKVLLAHREADEIEAVIAQVGLPAYTERTITDPVRLRDELEQVRTLGYARESEEALAGVRGVAAPIICERTVLAAIGISAPSERFARLADEYAQAIVGAAARVSRETNTRHPVPNEWQAGGASAPVPIGPRREQRLLDTQEAAS